MKPLGVLALVVLWAGGSGPLPPGTVVAGQVVDGAAPIVGFAGYDWQVKTSRGGVGPGPNVFGLDGVRVDRHGHLHLAIKQVSGHWLCSEVVLGQSLGYGEYRFVIRETAGLDASAVLGLFLWDKTAPEVNNRETDIEVSRWGDNRKANAQFVVQPYARPENLVRFELPRGRAVLSFNWMPGRLDCRAQVQGRIVSTHSFTKGVHEPGRENVRLNLWLYRTTPPVDGKAVEVVVDSFKFIPPNKRR